SDMCVSDLVYILKIKVICQKHIQIKIGLVLKRILKRQFQIRIYKWLSISKRREALQIRRLIMDNLATLSSTMLYTAFAFYSIATIMFGVTIKDKKKQRKNKGRTGTIAISLTIIGLIAQLVYFITRWLAGGHAPVGNMFEFMTFLGLSIVLAFIIIYFIYR